MSSLKAKPAISSFFSSSLKAKFSCIPTETSASGLSSEAKKDSGCNISSGSFIFNESKMSATKNAQNGGNESTFFNINCQLVFPDEKSAAEKIPSVLNTKNEPGWSVIIAMLKPSLP